MSVFRLVSGGYLSKIPHLNSVSSLALTTPQLTRILHQRHLSTKVDDRVEGDLVYKGTISSMVRNVKLLSLSTSAVGLGFQPYLFLNSEHLGKAGLFVGGVFSIFIFVTPLLLHYITKKYVTELYMKPEEERFTAYTWTFLLRKKRLTFTPEDVMQPGVPGPFSTIMVKGKALFVDPNYFTDPGAYRAMMGYNKPIDWTFPEDIKAEDEINGRK